MKQPKTDHSDDDDGFDSARSPYDTEPSEQDLWFLPGPSETLEDGLFGMPERRVLIDPADWRAAEAGLAPQLARAAVELALLDQRCRDLGPGAVERLALIEVEAMLWTQGSRIRREQIAAHLSGAGSAHEDRRDLVQVAWAFRRLLQKPGPLPELRGFLGLHGVGAAELPERFSPRPKGAEFDLAAELFADGMAAIGGCHPLTRAGYGLALWRLAGISAPDDLIEPATAVARIAAQECRMIGFVPLAPGRGAWQLGIQPDRLADWLTAIRAGAQTAMMELNRVDAWATAARQTTARFKGSTPTKLIDALTTRPILTTEAAATLTGISRDSAERGLARLLDAGIVREITGGKRFRLWTSGQI